MGYNILTGEYTPTSVRKVKRYNILTRRYEEVEEEFEEQPKPVVPQNKGIADKFSSLYSAAETAFPVLRRSNVEILSAFNYASTKFVDTIATDGDIVKAFGDAFTEAAKTAKNAYNLSPLASVFGQINPNQDLPESKTYSDLIDKYYPEFGQKHPVAKHLIGFVGDVALDPTTYVSFGTKTGIQIAGRKISNKGINVIRELNGLAQDGFRVTVRNGTIDSIIDFGPDEVKHLQGILGKDYPRIGKLLSNEKLAEQELDDLIRPYIKEKGQIIDYRALTGPERNLSVERSFLNLAEQDTKLLDTGKSSLGLFIDIPFSPKRLTVISSSAVDTVYDKLGIKAIRDNIKDVLKNSNAIETFKHNFSRDLDLPYDYLEVRKVLEGDLNRVDHSLLNAVERFSNLPKDSKKKINELAIKIDTRIKDKIAGLDPGSSLSQKSVNATRQYWINKAVRDKELTPDEFDVFTRYISSHNQLSQLEIDTKLYNQAAKNYNPNSLLFSEQTLGKENFANLQDSLSKGVVPELDLSFISALRLRKVLRKQAYQNFDESLEFLYGNVNPQTGNTVMKFPEWVKKDIDFIGESTYSLRAQQAKGSLLKLYDKGLSTWKTLAYPVKPSAGVKQYFGNTLQGFSVIGVSAFKSLDPRSILDSVALLSSNTSFKRIIPQKIVDTVRKLGTETGQFVNAVNKYQPDFVKDVTITSRLNEKITGPQMFNELIDNDVIHKGLNVLDMDQARDLRLEIAKQEGWIPFQKAKWREGFFTFIKESIPWINMPGHVENTSRAGIYINARRMGYLPEQAKELLEKAVFPYAHGLSQFEQKTMRRLVPFYTFNRFAIPLIGSLLKEPGKAATLKKTTEKFFEIWQDFSGGTELTEAQREAFTPDFLIEQPSVYDGLDHTTGTIQKGVFRTFNNYLYTDYLS